MKAPDLVLFSFMFALKYISQLTTNMGIRVNPKSDVAMIVECKYAIPSVTSGRRHVPGDSRYHYVSQWEYGKAESGGHRTKWLIGLH